MDNLEIIDRFLWAFNKSPSYEQFILLGGKVPKRITNHTKWYGNLLTTNGYDKPTKANVYRVIFDKRRLVFIGTVGEICRKFGLTENQVDHSHHKGCTIDGCLNVHKINIEEEMYNIKDDNLFDMKIYKY